MQILAPNYSEQIELDADWSFKTKDSSLDLIKMLPEVQEWIKKELANNPTTSPYLELYYARKQNWAITLPSGTVLKFKRLQVSTKSAKRNGVEFEIKHSDDPRIGRRATGLWFIVEPEELKTMHYHVYDPKDHKNPTKGFPNANKFENAETPKQES